MRTVAIAEGRHADNGLEQSTRTWFPKLVVAGRATAPRQQPLFLCRAGLPGVDVPDE